MEKYKIITYVFVTLACAFSLSGINFNNFFKKNHIVEAKLFVVFITLALSYLVTNFIIEFLEISKII